MSTVMSPRRTADPIPAAVPGSVVTQTVVVAPHKSVCIPGYVKDLASFRRWVHSGEFPEKTRICYLNGEVWVDLTMEDFFPHNQVKSEFNIVVGGLIKVLRKGRYVPDGMLVTNVAANLSCEPDGMFVSHESFDSGRIRLVEGSKNNQIELEGTPDMALEIVSPSSVTKDTQKLRELFWAAGIPEYWLVDARGEEILFDIFRYTAKGYVATRKQAGWVKSALFGKSFRLGRSPDERGNPEYALQVK
jgi:Uma2 family endonuclease